MSGVLSEFLQFLFSGLTVGAIYGLIGLGFAVIYNASHVINFAQGEFVMIGGMATVFLMAAGLPMPLAVVLAIAGAALVGWLLARIGIETARGAGVVGLIIITIGASILLRGLAQVVWDRNFHPLPPISGDAPIHVFGATLLPQSLWIGAALIAIMAALRFFFDHTRTGKAMQAAAIDPLAAQLMGIDIRRLVRLSFVLSAALGALAGVLVAPITMTYANVGVMLGLKGFAAAIVGGLGNPLGAIAGGLVVGIAEAMTAGYLSSAWKDVVAFVIILFVLLFLPNGLFGRAEVHRA